MVLRTLTLGKGPRKYVFCYHSGCEQQIIDEIVRQVEDARSDLDWFDAAMLSFQITSYTAGECIQALAPGPEETGQEPESERFPL